jgi:uncharacterized protein YijF (DUF1287 family)
VTWDLGSGVTHIGIVSDRASSKGVPLVIYNIGQRTQEEDARFNFTSSGITGSDDCPKPPSTREA